MSQSTDRLLRAIQFPAGIEAEAMEFAWKGPDAHLAPTRATPLAKALMGKTNCALVVLMAASLLWSAKRLARLTDTGRCAQMAEALLCWQSDPLYWDEDGPRHEPGTTPRPSEAVLTLCRKSTAIFLTMPRRHIGDPPIQIVENIVALTRHVLGPGLERPFRAWLKATIERLDAVAPNPLQDFRSRYDFDSDAAYQDYKKANMGPPLPIELADPARELAPDDLPRLYADFLRQVDWVENPYLRSPEALRAAGFQGEPYQAR